MILRPTNGPVARQSGDAAGKTNPNAGMQTAGI
jgi:hypothetical protein